MGKKVRPWKSIRPPPTPETAETANATEHTPQPESNSRKGKIAVVALASGVAIVGIAVAFSLGGNKTTTPPQEPEAEDVIDDTDTNYTDTDEEDITNTNDGSTATDGPFDDPFANEFMELYVNDRIDEGNSVILDCPGEGEVEEYDDSLTVDKILDALEYNSLSNAVSDDPERIAGYIKRWMMDNGYPATVRDDIVYNDTNVLLSIYTDYSIDNNTSIAGVIRIENSGNQNKFRIRISNIVNPEDIKTYEYQSDKIPNYDTTVGIAQENLG